MAEPKAGSYYESPKGTPIYEFLESMTFPRANVIKYVYRADKKGSELSDLRKAAEYLKWEIERLENEQSS